MKKKNSKFKAYYVQFKNEGGEKEYERYKENLDNFTTHNVDYTGSRRLQVVVARSDENTVKMTMMIGLSESNVVVEKITKETIEDGGRHSLVADVVERILDTYKLDGF